MQHKNPVMQNAKCKTGFFNVFFRKELLLRMSLKSL